MRGQPEADILVAERKLRGVEQYDKLRKADIVFVSFGKSGRTWLRVMISHLFRVKYNLPDNAILGFDNFHNLNRNVPKMFFTHDNYIKDFTGDDSSKKPFYDKPVILLARDPRDVAVSQFFQWKFRIKPTKVAINNYPPRGSEISLFDFVMGDNGGSMAAVTNYLNLWAKRSDSWRSYSAWSRRRKKSRSRRVFSNPRSGPWMSKIFSLFRRNTGLISKPLGRTSRWPRTPSNSSVVCSFVIYAREWPWRPRAATRRSVPESGSTSRFLTRIRLRLRRRSTAIPRREVGSRRSRFTSLMRYAVCTSDTQLLVIPPDCTAIGSSPCGSRVSSLLASRLPQEKTGFLSVLEAQGRLLAARRDYIGYLESVATSVPEIEAACGRPIETLLKSEAEDK